MARDPLIVGRIPPDLDTAVRDYAGAHGLAVSAVLRDALRDYLAPGAPTPQPEPNSPAAPRTRSDARANAQCQHRTRTGSYCRACDRVIT